MPPADRGPGLQSPPDSSLKPNTTHVVKRELKTGTLGQNRRELPVQNVTRCIIGVRGNGHLKME
jgi:hypothetical protein